MTSQNEPTLVLQQTLGAAELDITTYPSSVSGALKMHNQTKRGANNFHSIFCERHNIDCNLNEHHEQDLLRAMLLFACSGLDATIKQLIRDNLADVIACDEGSQNQFAKFAERRLRRNGSDDSVGGSSSPPVLNVQFLAQILASSEPRDIILEALTRSLTNDSLQSRDQVLKVASHFALTRDEVLSDHNVTQLAFEARNQITHEMDIDFRDGKPRHRDYKDMILWTENILLVGETFISKISDKLR